MSDLSIELYWELGNKELKFGKYLTDHEIKITLFPSDLYFANKAVPASHSTSFNNCVVGDCLHIHASCKC